MTSRAKKEERMRGDAIERDAVFSYVSAAKRVPPDHPLRAVRTLVDAVLRELSPQFQKLYSHTGRPSIPPERLLRALLLQVLYSIRSERMLMEQLDYNLLFRWFVGLSMDDAIWDPTVFTKNRDRLLRGEKRRNQTHQSTTDPDARLYTKGSGQEAKLYFMGHVVMENRNGLAVGARLTQATGTAERDTALELLQDIPRLKRITVSGDKGYDVSSFVDALREDSATPHVARKNRYSAIDGRTTRHEAYNVSQRKRKRVEEIFGWLKTIGMIRKTRHRGLPRVDWIFTFALAAYNLVRIRNLSAAPA
jgi:transposase